ncbi:helix-turn-helix transcriptional regulator [Bacillus thermotolerans]|uniref:helix-turn-helix transcriptional regulator n=1 Tax=Bacillus thermotolerans TaxID=1221996 RepID=UPI0006174E3B|nr:helix-turn-helix transcriptional regulator [Bacillus thermotolerans]
MNTNRLKEVRIERGMSISELARRSRLSRATVTDIEMGRSNPTVKTIAAICEAISADPNEIFFGFPVNHEYQKIAKNRRLMTDD